MVVVVVFMSDCDTLALFVDISLRSSYYVFKIDEII